MPATNQSAFLLWSLAPSGLGTTISAAGNSGAWSAANPSAESPVDFRWVDDLALLVNVTGITSSPTFKVNVDVFDDQGNVYAAVASTANITGAGAAAPVYIGRHGGASGNFVVLPAWGRVSWTCTGGSVTGVQINLWGR